MAIRWPVGCTASNLQVTTDGYPSNFFSVSYSSTVTLRRSAAGGGTWTNTPLTCTVQGTGTKSCSDTTHTATITANDRLVIQVGNTGLIGQSPNFYATLTCE